MKPDTQAPGVASLPKERRVELARNARSLRGLLSDRTIALILRDLGEPAEEQDATVPSEAVTDEATGLPKPRYSLSQHRMTRCQSDDDGMCYDATVCPQLRDGEPARSGRHCPLDKDDP